MADLKFKSAAKSYKETMPTAQLADEYFQRICVDLNDFPNLEGELGDVVEMTIKAKVVSKRESETCNDQDMEIVSIGVPKKNPADETYESLTKPRGR